MLQHPSHERMVFIDGLNGLMINVLNGEMIHRGIIESTNPGGKG
jgi:hypothetical protein